MGRTADTTIPQHFTPPPGCEVIAGERVTCKHCEKPFIYNVSRGRIHLSKCIQWARIQAAQIAPTPASIQNYVCQLADAQIRLIQLQAARTLYVTGKPFTYFEHPEMITLYKMLNAAYKNPTVQQLSGDLLHQIYDEYKEKVKIILGAEKRLNIVFDASENTADERVLNVCVGVPYGPAYYWTTINCQDTDLTAANHLLFLLPILVDISGNDLQKINSFTTDTCNTMKATHKLIQAHPELRHCFTIFCDSHSLQLLIKDILHLPSFQATHKEASEIISFFTGAKKQLARLRALYDKRVTFITR